MNELIKIQTDGEKQTVEARELWYFLESKQDFSTWIKSRIKKFGFIENIDFIRFHKKMEANNANMVEYHISVEMAKELSMVENNEKGRQARRYFIQCEKALKTNQYLTLKDIPAIVSETVKAIIPVIKELIQSPNNLQLEKPKDKADYIGEHIAKQIRAKNERKEKAQKLELYLFEIKK